MVSFIKRSQLDLDSVVHKKVTIRSRYGVVHKKVTIVTFMNDNSHLDLDLDLKRSQL